MNDFGTWEVNISVDRYPQKIASALSKLNDQLVGAEYKPIAYLGSQVVNGVNHAVLAEQTVLSGKDIKNVVILIFNVKPNDIVATLVNIERVVESGDKCGGILVDVSTDIPDDAMNALNSVFCFVGFSIKPFAYLGSQVVKGINYIFAAETTNVAPDAKPRVSLIIANSMTGELSISDLLGTRADSMRLGYSFTWLKRQSTSLNGPLGEWP